MMHHIITIIGIITTIIVILWLTNHVSTTDVGPKKSIRMAFAHLRTQDCSWQHLVDDAKKAVEKCFRSICLCRS